MPTTSRSPNYLTRTRSRGRTKTPASPTTLPIDVESFTGRTAQLAELDQIYRRRRKKNTVVITAVSGIGGIGRTTLAVHWVHR